MPCDTIQLNQVEVGKMHPALLKAALAQLGAVGVSVGTQAAYFNLRGVGVRIAGGKMILPAGMEAIADQVKREYSRQCVIASAKQNGWKLRETKPYVFAVTK